MTPNPQTRNEMGVIGPAGIQDGGAIGQCRNDEKPSEGLGDPPAPHLPGEVGVWVFILGDMAVFAILFGVFLYYRGQAPAVFERSQLTLHRSFGLINTLLLLTSSLCVVTAVRGIRREIQRLPTALLGVSILCGIAFIFNKYLEWSGLIRHNHNPSSNAFYTYFFVLTGIHAFHLLIGIGVLTALLVLSRKPNLSRLQMMLFEGGACFWHMVDLLWIVLFALLYLVH